MSERSTRLSLSMTEVEATARKAARGAGYAWGLADVAGHATRGVCALGLDGCAALLAVLDRVAAADPGEFAPRDLDADWTARAGFLCPIIGGACLSDISRNLPVAGIGLNKVLMPVLLLPALADMARAIGPVTLSWSGGLIGIGEDGPPQVRAIARLAKVSETDLNVHPGGPPLPAATPVTRATPRAAVWQGLERFAARTYAPSTQTSRTTGAGAGAGLTDND